MNAVAITAITIIMATAVMSRVSVVTVSPGWVTAGVGDVSEGVVIGVIVSDGVVGCGECCADASVTPIAIDADELP